MRTRRRFWRIWHRRIGLTSCVLMIWLAVTGIGLNHADDWQLHQPSGLGALASWMGLGAECEPAAWGDSPQLLQCEELIFRNGKLLATGDPLLGALEHKGWLLLLDQTQLRIFTADGQLVDVLSPPAPSRSFEGLASDGKSLWLNSPEHWWEFDTDELRLNRSSQAVPLPLMRARNTLSPAEHAEASRRASGQRLSWTRLLQELHSGRILARFGPWLLDLAGVCLILLAGLGLLINARRSPQGDHRAGAKHAGKPSA